MKLQLGRKTCFSTVQAQERDSYLLTLRDALVPDLDESSLHDSRRGKSIHLHAHLSGATMTCFRQILVYLFPSYNIECMKTHLRLLGLDVPYQGSKQDPPRHLSTKSARRR
ncbi:hypothetical protein AKJ16_DCAP12002 [Drosera capensis]